MAYATVNDLSALEIFNLFQGQYENQICEITNTSDDKKKLIATYVEWIKDLSKQNSMLIGIVKELEQESGARMKLFERKVADIYARSRNSMVEMNSVLEFINFLKSDLFNLVEFLNRLLFMPSRGIEIKFEDLSFNFIDLNAIFAINNKKIFSDCDKHLDDIEQKNKIIAEQSDKIARLSGLFVNTDLKNEFQSRNRKLLSQLKFKDDLIDTMRTELESIKSHDCLQNYADDYKLQLDSFMEKYKALETVLLKDQNDCNVNDLVKRKGDIIHLQSETIEISQRNVYDLMEKIQKIKLHKDRNEAKLEQSRNLLLNYQKLISDLENMLQDNKQKMCNFEKTIYLHKNTISILEDANLCNLKQIQEKDTEIRGLSNKISEFQSNYFALVHENQESISLLGNEIKTLKLEIDRLNQEIVNRDLKIINNEQKLIDAQRFADDKSAELNKFLEMKCQLEQIFEQFEKKFANLSEKVDYYGKKSSKKGDDTLVESLSAHYKILNEKLQCYEQVLLENQQKDNRIEQMQSELKRFANMEVELKELNAKHCVLESDAVRLFEEREQLRQSLNAISFERNNANEKAAMLKSEIVRQKVINSDLEQENRLQVDRICDLQMEHNYLLLTQDDYNTKFNKLTSELHEKIRLIETLTSELETYKRNLNESLQKERNLCNELNNRDDQLSKLLKRNKSLELNDKKVREALQAKESEIRVLQKSFEQVQLENSDLIDEKTDLRNIFEQLIQKDTYSHKPENSNLETNMDAFDISDTFSEYWLQKIKCISKELIKSNTFWRNQWNQKNIPNLNS